MKVEKRKGVWVNELIGISSFYTVEQQNSTFEYFKKKQKFHFFSAKLSHEVWLFLRMESWFAN